MNETAYLISMGGMALAMLVLNYVHRLHIRAIRAEMGLAIKLTEFKDTLKTEVVKELTTVQERQLKELAAKLHEIDAQRLSMTKIAAALIYWCADPKHVHRGATNKDGFQAVTIRHTLPPSVRKVCASWRHALVKFEDKDDGSVGLLLECTELVRENVTTIDPVPPAEPQQPLPL